VMNVTLRLGLISESMFGGRAGEEWDPICLNTPPRRSLE